MHNNFGHKMASRFYIFKYLQGANTELRPAHVVEENKKDIYSRLFFALNGVLEKWEMCP